MTNTNRSSRRSFVRLVTLIIGIVLAMGLNAWAGSGFAVINSVSTFLGVTSPNPNSLYADVASPTIMTTGTVGDFGSVTVGTISSEKTYTVSGANLTNAIIVTAPSTDFQVSKTTSTGFGNSITFTQSGGTVATSTVFVRFTPQSAGVLSGDLANVSINAMTQNVAVSGTGVAAVCTVPPSGMTMWHRAEGNATDAIGSNNGTLLGGATFAAGKVGQAYDLSGANNQYISLNANALPLGSADRTVDMWAFVRNATGNHEFFGYGNFSFHNVFGIDVAGLTAAGSVQLEVFTFGEDISSLDSGVPLNQWMHIAVTYSGTDLRLYVNGQLKGTRTLSSPLDTTAANAGIGHFSGFFNGRIDEVEVFNRALGAGEIANLYNASSAGKCLPPSVTNVSPAYGTTLGDTSVTITGTDLAGATAVSFGAAAAIGLTDNTATSITVTSPAHVAGTVDVTVTTPNGTSRTSVNDQFIYVTPGILAPTVTAISPPFGPTAGGTAVTITGTNFTDATRVTIGGAAAASVVVSNDTTITAVTPAGNAGMASILVTTPGGINDANTLFTYVAPPPPPPTVMGINPTIGTTAGGTTVTITGTNFTGATAVVIGGAAATSVVVGSTTSITAVTPAHAAGVVSVEVTTPGGTNSANSLYAYAVLPPESIMVNTNDDQDLGSCTPSPGHCSLREAIAAANLAPDTNTITFDDAVTGNINLLTALPVISQSLSITGPGSSLLTVRRSAGTHLGILQIAALKSATIAGLTIADGDQSGIYTSGATALTVTDSVVTRNKRGIRSSGPVLTLTRCTISLNQGDATNPGGGIFATGLTNFTDLVVQGNGDPAIDPSKGGIEVQEGNIGGTWTRVNVLDNYSGQVGGGANISNSAFASPLGLTITDSIFSGNRTRHDGGGIYIVNSQAKVTIRNSAVTENTATDGVGGGIAANGIFTAINTTVTGNRVLSGCGGGIFVAQESKPMLINSTVAFNRSQSSAGGVFTQASASAPTNGRLALLNTIVAKNVSDTVSNKQDFGDNFDDSISHFVSRGHNLIGNRTGTSPANYVASDLPDGTDPLLAPLGSYGGLTRTLALRSVSPALNAGDNCVLDNTCTPTLNLILSNDQRGIARPQASLVDIGAYEVKTGLTLSPGMLPNGTNGVSYNQAITPSDGTSPYAFVVGSGTAPTGLALSPAGVLSGTPTANGTFNFTAFVTDTDGTQGEQSYSVTIAPPPPSTPTDTPTSTPTSTSTSTPTSTPTFTPTPGTISGTVTYGNDQVVGPSPRFVPGVLISSDGSPPVSDTTLADGTYLLTGFGSGAYTITPSKPGGQSNAVTSFDAARIAQYAAGMISFNSAQLSVADVSGNGGVTSFDAGLVARYAVGAPDAGSAGNWFFTPASNSHAAIGASIAGENYIALLMGEVSGNWSDGSMSRPAGSDGPERATDVAAPRLAAPAGSDIIVPIRVEGAATKDIISYEFELSYDPSVIQPLADPIELAGTVSLSLSAVANAETPGLLKVAVYGTMPLGSDGILLDLRFVAVGPAGSVSPLTFARVMFNEGTPRSQAMDGRVEITAATPNQAEISGRLLTAMGQGISNARVILTDTAGQDRSVLSDGFGVYRFGNLQVGQIYTIRVVSRRFTIMPVAVSVNDQLVGLDLRAAR